MHKYSLSIERLSINEQQQEIENFKNCGWEYLGNSQLANVHIFAEFQWNSPSEPVIPSKYGKYKIDNPVKCQGFL